MKIHNRFLLRFALVLGFAAAGSTGFAQTEDTQTFTVTVPSSLSITAPADATLTHDTTNDDQVFTPDDDPANHWQVLCNAADGATVSLTTSTPFVHATDASYERDAKLDLAVSASDNDGSGSAIWSVDTASDSTDYGAGDDDATVQASSAVPGKASLALTVTFITDTYSTLLEGDYSLDVVGTISAN